MKILLTNPQLSHALNRCATVKETRMKERKYLN